MTSNKLHFAIYTEDIPGTEDIANKALGDQPYSLVKQQGIWAGQRESSLAIHVIVDWPVSQAMAACLRDLADTIKLINKQDCVLVESWPVRVKLF